MELHAHEVFAGSGGGKRLSVCAGSNGGRAVRHCKAVDKIEPFSRFDVLKKQFGLRGFELGKDSVPPHVRKRQSGRIELADIRINEAKQIHSARFFTAAAKELLSKTDTQKRLMGLADQLGKSAFRQCRHSRFGGADAR